VYIYLGGEVLKMTNCFLNFLMNIFTNSISDFDILTVE
jgi:hypothetical protein